MAEEVAGVSAGPLIQDLVPIDKDGNNSDPKWNAMVAVMAKNNRLGKHFASPPFNSVLGTGTYGKVWRAKHISGNVFAVKNLRTKAAAREREVFANLQRRQHPCIVNLYHVQDFADTDTCSLVMELCEGGDLMNEIKRVRGLGPYVTPARSQIWMGQVFLGLEHMHMGTETLFRDLKPGNILLDAQGNVKLADFGVSRVGTESAGLWTFGNPSGSPGYVAPEILRQESYNSKADLYSFGVLLWVMHSGGLRQYSDPQPPTDARKMGRTSAGGPDYSALFGDCKLLQMQVEDVSGETAPAITCPVQDLVLRLIQESAADRLDHAGVREHPFFSELCLPPPGADPETVVVWQTGFGGRAIQLDAQAEDIGGD